MCLNAVSTRYLCLAGGVASLVLQAPGPTSIVRAQMQICRWSSARLVECARCVAQSRRAPWT
eukprot:11192683-Lingulodinium_polyedra.AAC.1